ncbi:hypothetical protein [Companilactobacillus alimentarius]|uniref:hypothetical protein n=1 Tax=Companilactobacillus alimentarius TaxID=1602 RepID=UPI0028B6D034|nr:hypothetical protein [Companilactobacillus alimentarius]MDT6951837.1 hypothetical protein [Companilactobacillus alimentarius]
MTQIKGITVILMDKVKDGTDGFGKLLFKEKPIEIQNVLVSPTSTDDVTNELNLTGKKAIYDLAIPKGDTHDWINKKVQFFGKTWRTIGVPLEGIEDMIPLDWNKKVTVEYYG